MPKYSHILYPTINSEYCKKALVHVKRFARVFECKVSIISVYQIPYGFANNITSLPPSIYEQYKNDNKKHAQDIVNQIESELLGYKIEIEKVIKEGNPKKIICEYAKESNCDIIIMGAKGGSSMDYVGSTSSYVIHNTPNKAVLVVN